jgi:beta-glucosidase
MARLDDMVHRILRTEFARGLVDDPQPTRAPDALAGLRLAQRAAEESMVLLKNGHGLLPLNAAAVKAIAVIGGFADAGVLSGGGSAQVDPAGGNPLQDPSRRNAPGAMHRRVVFHRSPPLDAIRQAAPAAKVAFDSGMDADRAAAAAKAADVAIVFVLQHTHEGEDVNSLALPNGQDALVAKVAAANPRTIVVIESGAAVLTPWARQVGAILEAWYPGIRGGEAVANVLFGNVNPSGKLAVTFPASDADLPHPALPVLPAGTPEARAAALVGNLPFGAPYDEGLKLGYKWFDAEKKKPAFPFGFGLSYTAFAYSGLKAAGGASLAVSFVVRNSGLRAGQEVAQVYLSFPAAAGEPPKRLIGWQKVSLAAGESKTVSLTIDPLYVSVFDVAANRWRIVPGDYQVMAGPSSAALPLSSAVKLDGDK